MSCCRQQWPGHDRREILLQRKSVAEWRREVVKFHMVNFSDWGGIGHWTRVE